MLTFNFSIEQTNLILSALGKTQTEINQILSEIQKQATEQLPQAPSPSEEEKPQTE